MKQYNRKIGAYVMWLYSYSPDQLNSGFLGIFCSNHENGGNMALFRAINIAVTEKEFCSINFKNFNYWYFFTYLLSIRRTGGTYDSFSKYDSMQSALIHLFESGKVSISNKDRDKLLEYMTSFCKSIASEKREKVIKV